MLSFFVKKRVEVPFPDHLQRSGMVPLLYRNRLLRRSPLIPESLNQPTTLKGGQAAAWGPTGCASLSSLLAGWPHSRRPDITSPSLLNLLQPWSSADSLSFGCAALRRAWSPALSCFCPELSRAQPRASHTCSLRFLLSSSSVAWTAYCP